MGEKFSRLMDDATDKPNTWLCLKSQIPHVLSSLKHRKFKYLLRIALWKRFCYQTNTLNLSNMLTHEMLNYVVFSENFNFVIHYNTSIAPWHHASMIVLLKWLTFRFKHGVTPNYSQSIPKSKLLLEKTFVPLIDCQW